MKKKYNIICITILVLMLLLSSCQLHISLPHDIEQMRITDVFCLSTSLEGWQFKLKSTNEVILSREQETDRTESFTTTQDLGWFVIQKDSKTDKSVLAKAELLRPCDITQPDVYTEISCDDKAGYYCTNESPCIVIKLSDKTWMQITGYDSVDTILSVLGEMTLTDTNFYRNNDVSMFCKKFGMRGIIMSVPIVDGYSFENAAQDEHIVFDMVLAKTGDAVANVDVSVMSYDEVAKHANVHNACALVFENDEWIASENPFMLEDINPLSSGYVYQEGNAWVVCVQMLQHGEQVVQVQISAAGNTVTQYELMVLLNRIHFASAA